MRVCVLAHSFPRNKKDFSAAFMKEFSDGLVQAGNEVVVVIPFDREFKREDDPFKIVTYKYIWPETLHLLGYSKTMEADVELKRRAYFLLPFLLFFGTLALLRTVKKEKIDIINVHWILPNGVMAMIVSKLAGVPFVVTLPGTDAYLAYRFKPFGWVAKLVAQSARGIISNSSWHLNRILRLGIKNKKTAVLSYPIDFSKLRPRGSGLDVYRKRHGLTKDNFVVLAIGRLVYKKGFDFLIKAMPEVIAKYPQARLLIGGEGDLRQDLERLAKRFNFEDKVIFTGTIKRDEIIYYYNLADVMVAPSIVDKSGNVDGGPVVSFESMACAKPQVATNVLSVADIIEDGVNGYVVAQKNTKALSEALIKLIKSPVLRKKMGEANRKLIKSQLGTRSIGVKYTKFFNEVISSINALC